MCGKFEFLLSDKMKFFVSYLEHIPIVKREDRWYSERLNYELHY